MSSPGTRHKLVTTSSIEGLAARSSIKLIHHTRKHKIENNREQGTGIEGTRTLLVTKGIATRNKDATGNKEQEFKEIRTPRTPSRKNHD